VIYLVRLISLCIGYAFGLFQTAYIYGRLNGFDLKNSGSGNYGTTNMLRTKGAKAGGLVLLGDAFKCVFAVLVVYLIFKYTVGRYVSASENICGSRRCTRSQFSILYGL